tara:strand:+ start:1344 stop:2693 length:1350 start_codon:yes stop_codon:yes gene_type:complete
MLKTITVSISYYNQDKKIILRHLNNLKSFPVNVKNSLSFQIIDNCSKISLKEILNQEDLTELDITIYRIDKDTKDSIVNVRDFGAKECKTPWYLPLNMNTVLPLKTTRRLLALAHKHVNSKKKIYRFKGQVVNNDKHKKNLSILPDVYFLKTEDYCDIGENDKNFDGNNGVLDRHYLDYYPEDEPENLKLEKIENVYFVTSFFGDKKMLRLSSNFKKYSNARYLFFTNLSSEVVCNSEWEIITVDSEFLEKLKQEVSGSAVKVSRYFKFHVFEYTKKYMNLDLHQQYLFYCDHYLYPVHNEDWLSISNQQFQDESADIHILQYDHPLFKRGIDGDLKSIVRYKKDLGGNIANTRKFLRSINNKIEFNTQQYYENTVFGLYLDDKVIAHLKEFWNLYKESPSHRDQPIWNFLYLHKNIKPIIWNKLRHKKFKGDKKGEYTIFNYKKADNF